MLHQSHSCARWLFSHTLQGGNPAFAERCVAAAARVASEMHQAVPGLKLLARSLAMRLLLADAVLEYAQVRHRARSLLACPFRFTVEQQLLKAADPCIRSL
jgi:hypothetical protein